MELESFQIPKSYQSYLEQFESDPERAIERLKNRVEKRQSGAVGYFFLAWLHLKNQNKEQAIESALKAKVLAPGSRFMERLPYFVQHPHSFSAWQPKETKTEIKKRIQFIERGYPIQDLDLLITKLSSIEKKQFNDNDQKSDQLDLSKLSTDVEDIVTETLAIIHEKQNNLTAAIKTYQRLISENSTKKEYYSEQIERLKMKKAEDKESASKKN
ncbi:MAG: hypothetical protein WD513_01455 [Balneolaceae bacterium]